MVEPDVNSALRSAYAILEITAFCSISRKEIELLWVDYPKFGQYDELIRLDRMPHQVQEWVLRYTKQTYPHFREHLLGDIEKYQTFV